MVEINAGSKVNEEYVSFDTIPLWKNKDSHTQWSKNKQNRHDHLK